MAEVEFTKTERGFPVATLDVRPEMGERVELQASSAIDFDVPGGFENPGTMGYRFAKAVVAPAPPVDAKERPNA